MSVTNIFKYFINIILIITVKTCSSTGYEPGTPVTQ